MATELIRATSFVSIGFHSLILSGAIVGGAATFSGTDFQARIIAYIGAHILAMQPLEIAGSRRRIPIAVSGETGGSGDDVRVEFAESEPLEIQAKHGLTRGPRLDEFVENLRDSVEDGTALETVLAVDLSASGPVKFELPSDLNRARSGRMDGLKGITESLASLAGGYAPLRYLHVQLMDLDGATASGVQMAKLRLAIVLEQESQLASAWDALVADAIYVCSQRLRRDRAALVQLLHERGIATKPVGLNERLHGTLDFSKQLLRQQYPGPALEHLSAVESQMLATASDPRLRYRIAQQRGAAYLQLARPDLALQQSLRALEFQPDGLHALIVAAFARMELGDLEKAQVAIDRVVELHPHDADAWAAYIRHCEMTGRNPAPVPESCARSREVLLVMADNAMRRGELPLAISMAQEILQAGDDEPYAILILATALVNSTIAGPTGDREMEEALERAEALTTSIIARYADEGHPHVLRAYNVRTVARQQMGKESEADEDIAKVLAIRAGDTQALARKVQSLLHKGDSRAAHACMEHIAPTSDGFLIALRAKTRLAMGDADGARNDLLVAIDQAGVDHSAYEARLLGADVAIDLEDCRLCRALLMGTEVSGAGDPRYHLSVGRLCLLERRTDDARLAFEQAMKLDPRRTSEYLAELGMGLLREGDRKGASSYLDMVDASDLPRAAHRHFGRALLALGRFEKLRAFVDSLRAADVEDDWIEAVQIEVALRTNDMEMVKNLVGEMASVTTVPFEARHEVARRLLEHGEYEMARMLIGAMCVQRTANPIHLIGLAQLLVEIDLCDQALDLGLEAYQRAPNRAEIHRGIIYLALTCLMDRPPQTAVTANTCVIIENRAYGKLKLRILRTEPVDVNRSERLLSASPEFNGKVVGDELLWNRGLGEEQWRIVEIMPVIAEIAQDMMLNYATRFPGEPFVVAAVPIPDIHSVDAISGIIGPLEQKRRSVEHAFDQYNEYHLPLGVLARLVGGTILDVIDHIIADRSRCGSYQVEPANQLEQREAQFTALSVPRAVITQSALGAIDRYGLHEAVAASFELVAPWSLHSEILKQVRVAQEALEAGRQSLAIEGGVLRAVSIGAGDPRLQAEVDRLLRLVAWLKDSVKFVPLPATMMNEVAVELGDAREMLGASSWDALAIANGEDTALYCDDLGLRMISKAAGAVRTFSSVTLVAALESGRRIDSGESARLQLNLLRDGYATLLPSAELIAFALREASGGGESDVNRAIDALACPAMPLVSVAGIASEAIRRYAISDLQVLSFEDVARRIVVAVAGRWGPRASAFAVAQEAQKKLALLPRYLDVVERVCRDLGRS